MKKTTLNVMIILALAIPAYADSFGLSKTLRAVAGADTVRHVWVRFKERGARGDALSVSEDAALRRRKAGFTGVDRAIDPAYIADIERRGGRLRHEFPWDNAASFAVHASRLIEISSLPYVKSVSPVAVYVRGNAGATDRRRVAAPRAAMTAGYGWHGEMVDIPLAHDYIRAKGLGNPGDGTIVAFFDTGFRLSHRAFTSGRDSSAFLVDAYDFVDGDMTVFDPDSVNNDWYHPYFRNDRHGTQCLGLVAGRDPDSYVGAAWGARFLLARTEDYDVEARTEEDNWAAAVVWAEARGAQIISSSLGYRDEFDDPSDDYGYGDMDGATTIVSRAAAGAVARGVIVVNAMGNENNHIPGTIIAPADVDGVVAVGAVDGSGRIARFSSSGPTADGRSKPDVVAPGVSVPLVDPHVASLAAYTQGNGTSFAAPIVSGIFSLILQARPGIGAQEARERLYASCAFASGQTVASDNLHGYGIPSALRAIMDDDEIFVKLTDEAGSPLRGATIRVSARTYTTNESGVAVISASASELPLDARVFLMGEPVKTFTVATLPFVGEYALDVNMGSIGYNTLSNVVKRGNIVLGRYYVSPSDASKPVVAVVSAINGRTVWSQRLRVRPDGIAEFAWNRRAGGGERVAPGVYLLTVRHGGNSVSRKFVIAN